MPLVLGIDEAGYGPLLGPLVCGATLWQMPPELVGGDLWATLSDCVARGKAHGATRLPVDDSKRVYDRKRGISSLERTVLAFAHALERPASTLGELLDGLSDGCGAVRSACPWYADLSRPLPADRVRSACEGAAQRLREVFATGQVACRGLAVRWIPEDRFNERVAQTHNKAAVEIEAVLRLMEWGLARSGGQDVYVWVDRLGGRADYRSILMSAFPERHLHVLEVGETCSRYRLGAQESDWQVAFQVDADRDHLPVALASMLAKYVRELCMEQFNAYWTHRVSGLRPTAGYYVDAQRFLGEIRPHLTPAEPPLEAFVRER